MDWNESYSATVRKYDFNKNSAGYSRIKNLINGRYLSEYSFTLCHNNSDFYYCFTTNDDDEIDISSCYEIRLTKKAKDYPAMNKSYSTSKAYIWIEYEFLNYDAAQEALNDVL